MSYIIYYSDPAKTSYPINVADNTIYNGVGTGGLTLVGRNYPAYGQYIAEDLIHLLENFASPVPPTNPVEGQLWYDNINRKLKFNNGLASSANWKPINGLYQQELEPTDAVLGDIWIDTANVLAKVYDGSNFNSLAGTEYNSVTSTGLKLETVYDSTNQPHNVVNIYINGEVYATISDDAFLTGEVSQYLTDIKPGLNIRTDSAFNGTADAANYLVQSGNKIAGNLFVRNDLNQTLNGQIIVAQDSNAFRIGSDPTFILERTSNGSNANFVNTYRYNGTFSFNIKDDYFANVRVMTVGNRVTVYGSEQATDSASGAFVVVGGAGIGKDLYVGGNLKFTNSTASIIVANITATSKIDVTGDLYFNRNLFAYENASSSNLAKGTPGQILVSDGVSKVYWATLNSSGYNGGPVTAPIYTSDATNSSPSGIGSYLNGAISTPGGASFAKDVNIGGVTNLTTLTGTTSTFDYIKVNESLAVVKDTNATSTITGAVIIAGGVGIGKDLWVGGDIYASKLVIDETVINSTVIETNDTFRVTTTTNATSPATGALQVAGGIGLAKDLWVGGRSVILAVTDATSTATGALQVRGGAGIAGSLYVGGPTAYVAGSPVVTTATLGAARIDGNTILATVTGTMYINTSTPVYTATYATYVSTTATTGRIGGIKIGSNIDITGEGVVSLSPATSSKLGLVIVTENGGLINNGGTIQVLTATSTLLGGVRIGTGVGISSNGTIFIQTSTLMTQAVSITTPASATAFGAVRIGSGIDVTTSGTISVNTAGFTYVLQTATNIVLGGVRINPTEPDIVVDPGYGSLILNKTFTGTNGIVVSSAWDAINEVHVVTYDLSTASSVQLGGVKIGNGFAVDADGTINVTTASYSLFTATNTQLGGVKIGTGIAAAIDGTISLNTATLVNTATYATYISTTATNTQLGGVKIGANINVTADGTISVTAGAGYTLSTATASVLGGVKIGTGIDIDGNAVITLNTSTLVTTATTARYVSTPAAAGQLGGVKIGSNVSVTADGTISVAAPYSLVTATASVLGGVVIGTGINIDGNAVITLNTATLVNTATYATYISTIASAVDLGGVKVGGNMSVAGDGTLTFNTSTLVTTATTARFISTTATNTQLGGVKISSQFTATSDGLIYINTASLLVNTSTYSRFVTTPATTTTLGGVKAGSTVYIAPDGTIDFNPVSVVNTATYAQFVTTPATMSQLGGVIIGAGIDVLLNGTISLNTNTLVSTAVRTLTTATNLQLGAVKISSQFTATGDGTIYINTASLFVNTATSAYTATYATYVSSSATNTRLGGIKIGTGFNVLDDGTVSVAPAGYVLPTATTSTLGGITGVVNSNVALGLYAGWNLQGNNSVAIGNSAGGNLQGTNSVAIGPFASTSTQSQLAIAIGPYAGSNGQGDSAVAIGSNAGRFTQGYSAIALGNNAGTNNQPPMSIIINATEGYVNATTSSSLLIAPIRQDVATPHVMFYNPLTFEVTTSTPTTIPVAIGSTAVTQANGTGTGALRAAGGASVGGDLWLGGNIRAIGQVTATGITLSGIATITNVTQATGTGTGALKVAGGASVGGDLWVGGSARLTNNVTATNVVATNVTASNSVLVTGTGGIGYTTGAGGSAIQTTSRTNSVTVNKLAGSITLVSAAGTSTYQSFSVSNSTVAATDVIIVNQKSGTDLYETFVTAVGASTFTITFATTGGQTTEQPVFNFAVIKAVTA